MRACGAVFGARSALVARALQQTGHPIWPAATSCQLLTLEHSIAAIAAAQSITTSHLHRHARSTSTAADEQLTDVPKMHRARTYTLQVLRLGATTVTAAAESQQTPNICRAST